MTTITDIIIECPKADDEKGENWAYLATDAWIEEARQCGLGVMEVAWDDETWDLDYTRDAGLVTDGSGTIYVLYIDPRTRFVSASPAEPKEEED